MKEYLGSSRAPGRNEASTENSVVISVLSSSLSGRLLLPLLSIAVLLKTGICSFGYTSTLGKLHGRLSCSVNDPKMQTLKNGLLCAVILASGPLPSVSFPIPFFRSLSQAWLELVHGCVQFPIHESGWGEFIEEKGLTYRIQSSCNIPYAHRP